MRPARCSSLSHSLTLSERLQVLKECQGMEGPGVPGSRSNLNRWEHGRGKWRVEIPLMVAALGSKNVGGSSSHGPFSRVSAPMHASGSSRPWKCRQTLFFFSSPTLITPRDSGGQSARFLQPTLVLEETNQTTGPPVSTPLPTGVMPGSKAEPKIRHE